MIRTIRTDTGGEGVTRIAWRLRSDQVMSEVLDGEAVIIDMASGRYHAAMGVGSTVWEAILAGFSMEDIVSEVGKRHTDLPAEAADQIHQFIEQLVAAGLIVEDGEVQAKPSDDQKNGPETTTPWATPSLESHDDLADLLLLDPVHEVTEAGWPHAAPPGRD